MGGKIFPFSFLGGGAGLLRVRRGSEGLRPEGEGLRGEGRGARRSALLPAAGCGLHLCGWVAGRGVALDRGERRAAAASCDCERSATGDRGDPACDSARGGEGLQAASAVSTTTSDQSPSPRL